MFLSSTHISESMLKQTGSISKSTHDPKNENKWNYNVLDDTQPHICTTQELQRKHRKVKLDFARKRLKKLFCPERRVCGRMKQRLTCSRKITEEESEEEKRQQLLIQSKPHHLGNVVEALWWHGHVWLPIMSSSTYYYYYYLLKCRWIMIQNILQRFPAALEGREMEYSSTFKSVT